MATLEELIPQFHEFIADRAEWTYTNAYQQKVCPPEVRPNLKGHYLGLANSAFMRVSRGGILTTSKIQDPKQRAIEDAIASFDNSLLNSKKEYKGSYNSWEEAIAYLLDKKEFATLVFGVREAYKGLMTQGTLNRTPYDKVVEALTNAYNVALRMIYLPVDKSGQQQTKTASTQSKLSDRYDISYSFFVHDGKEYKATDKKGQLNTALKGLIKERILGREKSESVFKNLQPILANDRTVSRRHLHPEENDDGLALCVTSTCETTPIDYVGNTMQPIKSPDPKKRMPVRALLVPIGVEEDNIECGAVFGGDNYKKYQLKITLTKKIQI